MAQFQFPELSANISVILAQSDRKKMYRWKSQGGGALISGREVRCPSNRSSDDPVVHEVSQLIRVNEQVELLNRLYASSTPDEQLAFPSVMIAQLSEKNAAIVAHTLVELSRAGETLCKWERIDDATIALFDAIADKLALERCSFSERDRHDIHIATRRLYMSALKSLPRDSKLPNSDQRTAKWLIGTIEQLNAVEKRVRYLHLKGKLMALQNPSLDADRRVLKSRLDVLKFSTELSEALSEVERRSTEAATNLDFKTAMDLLRTLFERFMQEAAEKSALKAGKPPPVPGAKGINYFGSFKEYLENAGLLQKDEALVLADVHKYLSNEGSHKLGSAPEQFHVAHTTVIEWCMMIAGRVQTFVGSKP